MKTITLLFIIILTLLFNMQFALAKGNVSLTLDEQIIVIKKEMIELGQEIKMMEDLFLYPPENKVALYLSMDIGKLFVIYDVSIAINNEPVTKYTYSNREESGLKKGAAHQVYIGNYMPGKYNMTIVMNGMGPHNRKYKRAISHDFVKTDYPKLMQIIIYDDVRQQQPKFRVEDIALCKAC